MVKVGDGTGEVSFGRWSTPKSRRTDMQKSRFFVGLILIAAAVLMFVFGGGSYSTAGVIALGVLGLVSIAISRRK